MRSRIDFVNLSKSSFNTRLLQPPTRALCGQRRQCCGLESPCLLERCRQWSTTDGTGTNFGVLETAPFLDAMKMELVVTIQDNVSTKRV